MEIHENQWKSMEIDGNQWKLMKMNENQSNSMKIKLNRDIVVFVVSTQKNSGFLCW